MPRHKKEYRKSIVVWMCALWAVAGSSPASAQSGMPPHEGGTSGPVVADVVTTWPQGTFLESVGVDADGTVFVANHEHGGLERIEVDGRRTEVARLPGLITGILRQPDGSTLATGRVRGGSETVYRIGRGGDVAVLATAPDARFLNGLAQLDANTVLVADSNGGTIWRLDLRARTISPWLRHDLLAHRATSSRFPDNTAFPAANGIKRFGDAVYVSNSDRAAILRIPLGSDGGPGAPVVWADRLLADDFAFDRTGTVYVPTHPMNSVVRIAADGTRTTIATGEQGIVGPTAVTFGPDGRSLYVVGNSLVPYRGQQGPARLVRLDVSADAGSPVGLRQIQAPTFYMVTARTLPDGEAARQREGQAYLHFLQAHYNRIALGGQVLDDQGRVAERVYLIRAASTDEARTLMSGSPYFRSRVYGDLSVRPLQGMLGSLLGGVAWPPLADPATAGR